MNSPKKRTMPEPTRSASVAQRDEQRPSGPARRVSAISIERLFGQHSYRAPASGTLGDIAILYGDNGSGKTTLLKLAFRLLSSAPNRGHRTALYKIPFAKLEVLLSDGTTVTARRNESLLGPLQLDIAAPGQQVVSGLYSHAIEERFESRSFEEQYISALKSIGLTTYYLTDTRELISDALAHPDHRSERELADWLAARERLLRQRKPEEDEISRTLTVTHEWIRGHFIQSSNTGTENANTIYLDILRHLTKRDPPPDAEKAVDDLFVLLTRLQEESADYARFGFAPALDAEQMSAELNRASQPQREAMVAILEPYLRGVDAKYVSLSAIASSTTKLVDGLTNFFSGGKSIEYNAANGFRFLDNRGSPLKPEWLSSGEKHLVKLFCYTLVARDNPSLFLVDEPELSLNVKWQRILLDALASLAQGSPNQFIFASHSIEIIARHRESVVELLPKAEA